MTRKKLLLLLALLSVFVSMPVGARMLYAGSGVFVVGSNTVAGIVRHLAEACMGAHPDTFVSVSGGGTARGIKALRDGVAQIAMISADLDEDERGTLPLQTYTLSLDAVVPVVHAGNTVPSLSVEQLRGIFSGKITHWREVGGPDLPIVVLSHDGLSGTYEVWKQKVLGESAVVTPRAKVMETGPMQRQIAAEPGAVGYVPFARLSDKVRAPAVEGIAATPATIRNASFPLCRPLLLVTVQNPDEATKKVLQFFLNPQQGGKVQEMHDFIPAPQAQGK